jgi:hypothetical protein
MKKKLFLNYSDSDPDDRRIYQNLRLHLSPVSGRIEAWSPSNIAPGEEITNTIQTNFTNADAVIHLLSIHFENETQCVDLLKKSVESRKTNIPVLISSFDWESDPLLTNLKKEILPSHDSPVDTFTNQDQVFTSIIKAIRREVLGDDTPFEMKSDRRFYYVLSGIVLALGVVATLWVQATFAQLYISLMVFLMFCCIILFTLRKVVFPTNISSLH